MIHTHVLHIVISQATVARAEWAIRIAPLPLCTGAECGYGFHPWPLFSWTWLLQIDS